MIYTNENYIPPVVYCEPNKVEAQRMTDKDIQEAIENCIWRRDIRGAWVCDVDIAPCEKHIYDGRCPTLIELYAKERGTENE